MANPETRRIGLLWAQFSAYHGDRCEAVARRLAGRAEVLAVEVASSSATYAWARSGQLSAARKFTLFPGEIFERIGILRRLAAQFRALRNCRCVFVGISYAEPDIVVLTWLLWLSGVRVVLMSESKFDDYRRSLGLELFKSLVLAPYRAAVVGGRRHIAYARFLGFRRRPVLPGYDTVSIARVQAEGGSQDAPYAARPFIYVGRFVAKKNLIFLLDAYAHYARAAGGDARRLVMAGSGVLEAELREQALRLGMAGLVEFPGFLDAAEVSRRLNASLALLLPSEVEQWGLVVNEAVALGLPVVVSPAAGSGDALVRNLVNGYVVESGSVSGYARAMALLGGNEADWRAMAQASRERAWLGDSERLADAAEVLLHPGSEPASSRIAEFRAQLGAEPVKGGA